jgi:hypothetical protein
MMTETHPCCKCLDDFGNITEKFYDFVVRRGNDEEFSSVYTFSEEWLCFFWPIKLI